MPVSFVAESWPACVPVSGCSGRCAARAWHVDMLLGLLGFDFVWIDAEHTSLNDSDMPALCLAPRGAGCDPIVRILKENVSGCYRMLEAEAA